ncbi:MAG: hypothetical protein AB2598_15535 [Candidatus Thiodiazotropha sp.]
MKASEAIDQLNPQKWGQTNCNDRLQSLYQVRGNLKEYGGELVSGRGNFGNALCFENVEKSIIIDNFMSPGHMILTNKAAFDTLATNMTRYTVEPGWINLLRMMGGAVVNGFKGKDF